MLRFFLIIHQVEVLLSVEDEDIKVLVEYLQVSAIMLKTANGLSILRCFLHMLGPKPASVLLTDVFALAFKKFVLLANSTSIFTVGDILALTQVRVVAVKPIPLE